MSWIIPSKLIIVPQLTVKLPEDKEEKNAGCNEVHEQSAGRAD